MAKPLNTSDGWEDIVNNVDRHNARIRFEANLYQLKLKKKISKVVNFALGAILSVVLGFTGLLAPWLAGGAAVLLVCISCFLGGKFFLGNAFVLTKGFQIILKHIYASFSVPL